ncbi:PQQ-binding-like beta-propeller repeat protein [Streptomyces sp. NPDC012769]|uniref:outer membrane protein assembly factor BamB family protein n=1 Tax=Streptomyces sp. NPDC012769 TaxID=3364848 RepID=UPI00367DF4AA
MTHQPWYDHRPQQGPAPDNPYASGGPGPAQGPGPAPGFGPGPAPGFGHAPGPGFGPAPGPGFGHGPGAPPPRRRRPGPVPLLAAVIALLLVAAGGAYLLKERAADQRRTDAKPGPSATASPSARPPRTTAPVPEAERIPTPAEIAAARKPGEAAAWIAQDPTDLPRGNHLAHDLWIVGDTVVQAVHKKVTAYRLADGAELWSIPLPHPVCETPVDTTPDGRVVIVHRNRDSQQGSRCDQLRMIDLRTGRQGWHKELVQTGALDSTIIVRTAISGDTVAVVQDMKAAAYRIADGTRLYDIAKEDPGGCYPDDVAGGRRLLVVDTCALGAAEKGYSRVRSLDPVSGRVLWRHDTPRGRKIDKVLSTEPVVITTLDKVTYAEDWRVVALHPDGRVRGTVDPREKGFTHCADAGDAGEGVQNCRGAAVGPDTVFLGTEGKLGAYDLTTGKLRWGVQENTGRRLYPLLAAGPAVVVYEAATPSRPGLVRRIGPGAEKAVLLLKHPDAPRKQEYDALAGKTAYVRDRFLLAPSMVGGDDDRPSPRLLSFAP